MKKRTKTEPTETVRKIERLSFRSSVITGLASIILAIIYGAWGVHLSKQQLALAMKSDSTSINFKHIDTLISKTDTNLYKLSEIQRANNVLVANSYVQIDTLISLNKILRKEYSVAIDQFNMDAELATHKGRGELMKAFNDYNELLYLFVDLEPHIAIFRLQRQGHATVKIRTAQSRLTIIESIQNTLRKANNVDELMPGHNLANIYGDCITELMQYRILYINNIASGGLYDTSEDGRKSFDTLMYRVIDLVDTVLPNLDEGRFKVQANIKTIDSVIEINNKRANRR